MWPDFTVQAEGHEPVGLDTLTKVVSQRISLQSHHVESGTSELEFLFITWLRARYQHQPILRHRVMYAKHDKNIKVKQ
jgi:hypothetical protein